MRPEALKPRPECPEPGRWVAPDEWASETDVSVFLGNLVRLLKPDLVLETGTYTGHTACEMGVALRELGRGRLVSIELDRHRVKEATTRVSGLPVDVLMGSSLSYTPTGPIDLLFIDSEFPIRMDEVRRFQAWASPRCVVVAHDSAVPTNYPGVPAFLEAMQAVVAEGVVLPWLLLPTPRGLALTRYR